MNMKDFFSIKSVSLIQSYTSTIPTPYFLFSFFLFPHYGKRIQHCQLKEMENDIEVYEDGLYVKNLYFRLFK